MIRPPLLRQGFELVKRDKLEVTDDVSIIEALGLPVIVTPGAYTNIKVGSDMRTPVCVFYRLPKLLLARSPWGA